MVSLPRNPTTGYMGLVASHYRGTSQRFRPRIPRAWPPPSISVLESGLTMDPKLIQAAVAAHDKALDNAINNPGLVTSKADWAAINEALARMIGSADAGKFKALLTAFPQNADLQMALFAANNPADAKAWWSKGVHSPEVDDRKMEVLAFESIIFRVHVQVCGCIVLLVSY